MKAFLQTLGRAGQIPDLYLFQAQIIEAVGDLLVLSSIVYIHRLLFASLFNQFHHDVSHIR